jgi:pimeloyl-ACP methyl ester carboxylesterase
MLGQGRINMKDTKSIKKYVLVGSVIFLLIIIGFLFSSQTKEVKMTDFHPFKSPKAKQEYLRINEQRSKFWPIPYESLYANTSYGITHVRVSGSKNLPPLVLLPGKGGNSLMWYKNIESLSQKYRTYTVDPIFEFGLSSYTKNMKKSDEYIDWLDQLFDALNLGNQINLMGLSYGGWLTSQYTIKHPERLRKVVLIAPAATIIQIKPEFYIRGFLMTILPFRYLKESFFSWLFAEIANRGEAGKVFIKKTVDLDDEDSKLFKSMPVVIMPTVLSDTELKSIKIPVLFVVGENEKIYSAQDAVQRIKNIAPNIKTEIIPKASHDLIFSQPELVNKTVINFLK